VEALVADGKEALSEYDRGFSDANRRWVKALSDAIGWDHWTPTRIAAYVKALEDCDAGG
jgi:hypothetical protein